MALRECPDSGALWAERVASAPRPQRKSRSVDALKRCGDDARVVAAVARLFWLDRKVDKARAWFQRATTLDPSDGDHWASLYAFEKRFGGESRVAAAREACVAAAPNRGDFWCAARRTRRCGTTRSKKRWSASRSSCRGGRGDDGHCKCKNRFSISMSSYALGGRVPTRAFKKKATTTRLIDRTGAVSGAGARQGEIPAWRVGARRWHRSARASRSRSCWRSARGAGAWTTRATRTVRSGVWVAGRAEKLRARTSRTSDQGALLRGGAPAFASAASFPSLDVQPEHTANGTTRRHAFRENDPPIALTSPRLRAAPSREARRSSARPCV